MNRFFYNYIEIVELDKVLYVYLIMFQDVGTFSCKLVYIMFNKRFLWINKIDIRQYICVIR